MIITIEIPDYNKDNGFKYKWEPGYIIETEMDGDTIIIKANKEGLMSLAAQLLSLANGEIPSGYHLHYDKSNSLEEESLDLIIEKK